MVADWKWYTAVASLVLGEAVVVAMALLYGSEVNHVTRHSF